jgi:hypothetical protein
MFEEFAAAANEHVWPFSAHAEARNIGNLHALGGKIPHRLFQGHSDLFWVPLLVARITLAYQNPDTV